MGPTVAVANLTQSLVRVAYKFTVSHASGGTENERYVHGVSPTASTYQARVSLLVKHGGVAETPIAVATINEKAVVDLISRDGFRSSSPMVPRSHVLICTERKINNLELHFDDSHARFLTMISRGSSGWCRSRQCSMMIYSYGMAQLHKCAVN